MSETYENCVNNTTIDYDSNTLREKIILDNLYVKLPFKNFNTIDEIMNELKNTTPTNNHYYYLFQIIIIFSKYFNDTFIKKVIDTLEDVNKANDYGWTALMFASKYYDKYCSSSTIQMLLDTPNIDIQLQNKKGFDAIDIANINSNKGIVTLLKHKLKENAMKENSKGKHIHILKRLSNVLYNSKK